MKFITFSLFLILAPSFVWAGYVDENIEIKNFEISSVNYFQSNDRESFSTKISWLPTFLKKDWGEIKARLGFAPLVDSEGDRFNSIHSDLILAYNFLTAYQLEGVVGLEKWDDEDSFTEFGIGLNLDLADKFGKHFVSKYIHSAGITVTVVNTEYTDTKNIEINLRRSF